MDFLIDLLEKSPDSDRRDNSLTLIYFLHATPGSVKAPGLKDPRPENAQWNEPLTTSQLERLAKAALAEGDSLLWDSYCALFSCLREVVPFPPGAARDVKAFAEKCTRFGSHNAASRCRKLARIRIDP